MSILIFLEIIGIFLFLSISQSIFIYCQKLKINFLLFLKQFKPKYKNPFIYLLIEIYIYILVNLTIYREYNNYFLYINLTGLLIGSLLWLLLKQKINIYINKNI